MYTYVFAFYLSKNNQSAIFEVSSQSFTIFIKGKKQCEIIFNILQLLGQDNQKDLESATETLSEYLERDITSENLADIKQKVQDKYRFVNVYEYIDIGIINVEFGRFNSYFMFYRYCDSRRKVLLEHVHEGYEKDWWLYTKQKKPVILTHYLQKNS